MTVLFADIVGSTSIAERIDAEDWKRIADGALEAFASAVEQFGGRVAQLLGDGLLAFFGAPTAHEDDPLRAVRAGLAMVEIARRGRWAAGSAPDGRIEIRVGLATGEAVVGTVGGEGRREYLARGDVVNVAARLQGMAGPMTVLAAAETYRRVAPAVLATPRGPLVLKGKAEPVEAWEIGSIRAGTVRVGRQPAASRMIGRSEELDQLFGLAAELRAGQGRVATIVGEAGLGKTRLLREWKKAIDRQPGRTIGWLEASCMTNGRGLSYGLARSLLFALLGLAPDATPAAVAAGVHDRAARLPDFEDGEALLARILDLPRSPGLDLQLTGLDARAIQRRAARLVRALVEASATTCPIVLAIEDAHWIDPSSAELVAECVAAVNSAAVALCLTARPDHEPGAAIILEAIETLPADRRTEIALKPLSAVEQSHLVRELVDPHGSPEAMVELVCKRSDGNPLFVEELVRTFGAAGARMDGGSIPLSLQGLLLERVDALPRPVRELARVGSVVGREFSFDLARSVAIANGAVELPNAAMDAAASDGVLELMPGAPDRLVFRHALIHDAAYGSLVRGDRRRLHRLVGERLEAAAEAPELDGSLAPTLAFHFAQADDHPRALRYGRAAAARAASTYANSEAIELYELSIAAARALLVAAPDETEAADRRRTLFELLEADAWLVRRAGRYPEAEAIFREAYSLLPARPGSKRARWLGILGVCCSDRQAWDEERALQLEAEAVLGPAPDPDDADWWPAWIEIRGERAASAYWLNREDELAELIASLEEPVRLHGSIKDQAELEGLIVRYLHRRNRYLPSEEVRQHAAREFAAQIQVGDRADVGWAHFLLGFSLLWNLDFGPAEDELRIGTAEGDHIGDSLLVARSITYLSVALRRTRQIAETRETAERVIEVSRRLGIAQYVAIGLANRAWAALQAGDQVTAAADAAEALRIWPTVPPVPLRWLALWPAIAVDVAEDRASEAIAKCRELLDPSEQPPVESVGRALEGVLQAADTGLDPTASLARALRLGHEAAYL